MGGPQKLNREQRRQAFRDAAKKVGGKRSLLRKLQRIKATDKAK